MTQAIPPYPLVLIVWEDAHGIDHFGSPTVVKEAVDLVAEPYIVYTMGYLVEETKGYFKVAFSLDNMDSWRAHNILVVPRPYVRSVYRLSLGRPKARTKSKS